MIEINENMTPYNLIGKTLPNGYVAVVPFNKLGDYREILPLVGTENIYKLTEIKTNLTSHYKFEECIVTTSNFMGSKNVVPLHLLTDSQMSSFNEISLSDIKIIQEEDKKIPFSKNHFYKQVDTLEFFAENPNFSAIDDDIKIYTKLKSN